MNRTHFIKALTATILSTQFVGIGGSNDSSFDPSVEYGNRMSFLDDMCDDSLSYIHEQYTMEITAAIPRKYWKNVIVKINRPTPHPNDPLGLYWSASWHYSKHNRGNIRG